MAYKSSGKKARIQGSGGKRSSFTDRVANLGAPKKQPRKSKGQSGSGGNSRKTHDTKGRNNHGRSRW